MVILVSFDILMVVVLLAIAVIGGSAAAYNCFLFLLILSAVVAAAVGIYSVIKTITKEKEIIPIILIAAYKLAITAAIVYLTIIFRQELIASHDVGALEYLFELITGFIEYGFILLTGAFAMVLFDDDYDLTVWSVIALLVFIGLAVKNIM